MLAALSRIDEASYGQCVDCGHEIPEGRLDARPDAARCVGCQSKWAKRAPLAGGDPLTPQLGGLRPPTPRGLAGRDHQLRAERLVGPGREFGPHQLVRPPGSRRSQCVTTDSENTVRDRIQLTRSPAPVNSSRAWSGP